MSHFIKIIISATLLVFVPVSIASDYRALLEKLDENLVTTSPVPVYASLQLPELISNHGLEGTDININSKGYTLNYYFKDKTGHFDPTDYFLLAASISGQTYLISKGEKEYGPMPNTTKVELGNGTAGTFRPVSCGGSCAPANLWFEIGNYQYNVQIKMSSDTPKNEQLSALLVMANSVSREF